LSVTTETSGSSAKMADALVVQAMPRANIRLVALVLMFFLIFHLVLPKIGS
jgi:hypothetical protein